MYRMEGSETGKWVVIGEKLLDDEKKMLPRKTLTRWKASCYQSKYGDTWVKYRHVLMIQHYVIFKCQRSKNVNEVCSITAIFSGCDFIQIALGVTVVVCVCVLACQMNLCQAYWARVFSCPNKPFVIYTLQMEEGNKIWVNFETWHHDCVKMVRLRRSLFHFHSTSCPHFLLLFYS